MLPRLFLLFESNESFCVWNSSAWLCSTSVIYMLLCFFVRGNWVMRELFFLYFYRVSLWGTGVHAVWIEICHLKFFFGFGFLLVFLINWLCAIILCSEVRWSNWLLLWQFFFCLWALISPLIYGNCGSILVYFYF